jgi:IPT/TIG domain-containing protein
VRKLAQPRVFADATLLPDGNLLMTGGDPSYGAPATTTAELYTPAVLSVNPHSGPAGAQVTVSGSGYYAHESVRLQWDSVTVLGHVLTDNSGSFTTKVTIPPAAPGAHQIVSQGRRSLAEATATFTITG